MTIKRVLSGVQPSGTLHLGNYFGMMKPAIELQETAGTECLYFIADYHAMTTNPSPTELRDRVRGVAIDFLACGLDPKRTIFYRQSDVMQVRWGRHGDQSVIALCPASVRECFTLAVQAFNFAERFRVPVVLMPDEIVGHMRENVALPLPGEIEIVERKAPGGAPAAYLPFKPDADGVAPLAAYGSDYVFHVTSSMHGTDGYSNNDPANAAWRVRQLHEKIERHREDIVLTRAYYTEDMDVLIVAFGATTRSGRAAALEARAQGIKAGVLQLQTIWPFADKEIAALGRNARMVVVPEMNYSGQVAGEVRKALGAGADIRRVNKYNGTIITPQDILDAMQRPAAAKGEGN